jgi:nitronate monooxygenase
MGREVTDFLKRLGIELPIIQAPMAGVSSPAMAAAASNAGALGSIAVGAADADAAALMIGAVRASTGRPFNVNLFCHRPARVRPEAESDWIELFRSQFTAFGASPPVRLREIYRSFLVDDEMLGMLVDLKPAIVSFHFGLPGRHALDALRDTGAYLIATATSPAEAREIESAGVDAIVAQGWEAGGHRGCFDPDAPDARVGMAELTAQLVREVNVPVIAAGGIMDGAGIAKVLELGAAAAQLGTAFVGCAESLADTAYRQALCEAGVRGTIVTRVISGRPARCLANRFTAMDALVPAAAVPDYPRAYDLGKALNAAAAARGDFGFGAQWAGESAALARSLPTAALVQALAVELKEAQQ